MKNADDRIAQDFRMEALLADALPEAFAHQDAERFFAWMREHIGNYLSERARAEAQPGMTEALAFSFGHALWNVLPLPRNGFRPEPVPEPGRNDSCPCGSGLKYKHCCLRLPSIPLEADEIWPILFGVMSGDLREAALRSGALPRSALIALAQKQFEEEGAKPAVKLLEPLFHPQPVAHDEPMGSAFDLLCDAYERLGWSNKKTALIENVIVQSPRSPLRSDAWQRRCVIAMDRHNLAGARDAFREAQRNDPEAPMLSILEVELLLAEHQPEKARERADFHVRQLRRRGYPEDELPLTFLVRVARDPLAAMTDLALNFADEAGRGLLDWLATVADRALPAYRVVSDDELPEPGRDDDLVERLVQIGVPRGEAKKAVREMPEPDSGDTEEPAAFESGQVLLGPESLAATERAWHGCFPLTKPFSLANEPFDEADAWEAADERRWTAFLNKHPECFDSLDILDDLATAVMQHAQSGLPALNQTLLLPLLERTRAIVRHAVGEDDGVRLPWIESRNRPALRALVRLSLILQDARPDEAFEVVEWLLRLNPDDNHGFRAMIINRLLEDGDDRRALALAERYPDDILVETLYGHALALFRLGREAEAIRVLRKAVKERPKVGNYLLREKPRRPKLSEFGVTYGGDDEAWWYNEKMRSVWAATPGAMDWLRAEDNRRRRITGKGTRRKTRGA